MYFNNAFDDVDDGQLALEATKVFYDVHDIQNAVFGKTIPKCERRLGMIEKQVVKRGLAERYYAALCEAGNLDPGAVMSSWLISLFPITWKCKALIAVLSDVKEDTEVASQNRTT